MSVLIEFLRNAPLWLMVLIILFSWLATIGATVVIEAFLGKGLDEI